MDGDVNQDEKDGEELQHRALPLSGAAAAGTEAPPAGGSSGP